MRCGRSTCAVSRAHVLWPQHLCCGLGTCAVAVRRMYHLGYHLGNGGNGISAKIPLHLPRLVSCMGDPFPGPGARASGGSNCFQLYVRIGVTGKCPDLGSSKTPPAPSPVGLGGGLLGPLPELCRIVLTESHSFRFANFDSFSKL